MVHSRRIIKKTADIQRQNNLKKYGVECTLSLPEVIEKRQNTIKVKLEDNPNYYKEQAEKSYKTKLERYGDGNYHNIEQMCETNLKRYGVKYNFASKDGKLNGRGAQLAHWGHENFNNRKKAVQTMIERYGEDFFTKQIATMFKSPVYGGVSKPNKEFAAYLFEHGVKYEAEFPLGNYIYDFKVGDYLIEVDPWATHNSTFAPADWKPKDNMYHRNKTLNALKYNYKCIHVFDWINIDIVIYGVMTNQIKLVDTYIPVRHIYDRKLKKLTNEENENTVIIYDDGFELVY